MQARKASTQAAAVALAAAFLSTGAFAQSRPQPPAPAPGDFLNAVNETPGTVRVELFAAGDVPGKDARARMMACLQPKAAVHWKLGPASANARVRMQMIQGDTCDEKQRVACEQSFPLTPGLQHVALRGDGRSCGMSPIPAPAGGMLKAGGNPCGGPWVPLTIVNQDTKWALWATMYDVDRTFPKILYSACWMPGETRMACVDKHNYYVRAEMVGRSNERAATGCSELKRCDTLPDGKPLQHGPTGNAPLNSAPSATLTMADGGGCVFR